MSGGSGGRKARVPSGRAGAASGTARRPGAMLSTCERAASKAGAPGREREAAVFGRLRRGASKLQRSAARGAYATAVVQRQLPAPGERTCILPRAAANWGLSSSWKRKRSV